MSIPKPLQSPANSPKPSSPLQNKNYPSKTGNESGKGRGNTPKK